MRGGRGGQVPDGYRDLKLFVRFDDGRGLGIIGEIQARGMIINLTVLNKLLEPKSRRTKRNPLPPYHI